MTQTAIGIAAGAGLFLLCAALRWLPRWTVGKALLLVYFTAVGAWTGFSWSRLVNQAKAATRQLAAARLESAMDEVWPAPRPEKVTAEEIERIVRQVTERTVAGTLPAREVQALEEAARAMVGEKQLIDRDGYAATRDMEFFVTDVLPLRLRDRVAKRLPERRTRLFGYGLVLALVGAAAGGFSASAWRRPPQEPADA